MSDLPSTIARVLELDAAGTPDTFVESIGYTDAKLAAFATTKWLDGVAAVPLAEMAIMVAEDPSVMATLIGALRHARTAAPLLARECERLQELALDRWEEAEELRILPGNASQESLEGLVQRAHRDRDTARAEVERLRAGIALVLVSIDDARRLEGDGTVGRQILAGLLAEVPR